MSNEVGMNISQGVLEVFRQTFNNPALIIRANMVTGDIPGWDSFKNVEILLACEATFGIQFRSKEIDLIRSVGDLMMMCQQKWDALAAHR
jgi:acyl carrier protein